MGSSPSTNVFIKPRKVVKYYKHLCLAKASKKILEETRLRQHLEFWQIVLHFDTMNRTTNAKIKILRNNLQSLVDWKDEGRKIRSPTRWIHYEDRMNKYLFSSVRERTMGGLIT